MIAYKLYLVHIKNDHQLAWDRGTAAPAGLGEGRKPKNEICLGHRLATTAVSKRLFDKLIINYILALFIILLKNNKCLIIS